MSHSLRGLEGSPGGRNAISTTEQGLSDTRKSAGPGKVFGKSIKLLEVQWGPIFLTKYCCLAFSQLEVYGQNVEESDSLTDPELLMEIMEAREQLDECSSQEECDAIRVSNKGKPCIPMLRTVYPNHLSHFYRLSRSLSISRSS